MTLAAAEMGRAFTRWQRFIARFLPWFDADQAERRIRHTDAVVQEVRSSGIRVAYTKAGNRVERRRAPR